METQRILDALVVGKLLPTLKCVINVNSQKSLLWMCLKVFWVTGMVKVLSIYLWGGGANKWATTVSSPTEVLRKDALQESDHWGCSDISRAGTKQGHSWAVPPTFLLLPSLLNVLDFESESETNKTVHIRKRLHNLASLSYCTWLHRLHASHPNPLHTQRDPPRNSNAPLMKVPWRRLWI